MKLILTIPNEQDAQFVKELLSRLKLPLTVEEGEEAESQLPQSQKALEIIKNFPLEKSRVSQSIPDPVKWQREMRKDRKLPFRK